MTKRLTLYSHPRETNEVTTNQQKKYTDQLWKHEKKATKSWMSFTSNNNYARVHCPKDS